MSVLQSLWGRRRSAPGFALLAVATVAVLAVWPVVDIYLRAIGLGIPMRFADFTVYTTAVDHWLAGESIYTRTDAGGFHGSYLYPPITVVLFYPFAQLGWPTSGLVFGLLSIILLWLGLLAAIRAMGYDLRLWERLVVLAAIAGFQPALRDFKWGQLSTFLAAMLCLAFYAQEYQATRESSGRVAGYLSGAFTTLGSAYKLFFATSGAHLLRDRRRLAGALGTALLLVVASFALFGIETHRTYLEVLMWGKGWAARPPALWDTSAAYFPLAFLGPLEIPVRLLGIPAVIGLVLATRSVRDRHTRLATFALGVAVIPLLAPRADVHDLVVFLLPAVILLVVELERPGGYPWIPVVSVLLLHFHRYVVEFVVRPEPWVPLGDVLMDLAVWLQPGMWATFLLVGLAAYRVSVSDTPTLEGLATQVRSLTPE